MKERVIDFLNSIGIVVKKGTVPKKSFLPCLLIQDGEIFYEENFNISDMLHEAGHLALVPGEYRKFCTGDMGKAVRILWTIIEKVEGKIAPDSLIYRQLLQCGDPEATAWAFAAGVKNNIPPEIIILDRQYGGSGSSIRECLKHKCYLGINGLRAAGFIDSVKDYPKLKYWMN